MTFEGGVWNSDCADLAKKEKIRILIPDLYIGGIYAPEWSRAAEKINIEIYFEVFE